jgi:hypothetical protein
MESFANMKFNAAWGGFRWWWWYWRGGGYWGGGHLGQMTQ